MQKVIAIGLIIVFNIVLIFGQQQVLISNPSFEVKPKSEDPFPRGWLKVETEKYALAEVQWENANKKPSHGQSYVCVSRTEDNNQVISHLIAANPLQAYKTYRLNIDASIMNDSTISQLELIGWGATKNEQQTLATSWEIDHMDWKKINFKITPEFDILSLLLQVAPNRLNTAIAIDNISHIERIPGPFDCNGTLHVNNYSRYELASFSTVADGEKFITYEGRFHCPYTTFYTSKVLYDQFGEWDQVIFYPDGRNEKLLWRNVQLFDDSKEKYIIAASGYEDELDIYASIIVFDQNGLDILNPNHPKSLEVMDLIGSMIQKNNEKDKDFYDLYAEEVGY